MNRRLLQLTIAALVFTGAAAVTHVSPASAAATTYYVSTKGKDTNTGTSTTRALLTVNRALALAQPGDTVTLAAGTYLQDFTTVRSGTAAARITITGPRTAIVKGADGSRIVQVMHNHITLNGFTIDGKFASTNAATSYRDKLIYAQGTGQLSGVNGLRVTNMSLKNAAGECVRLRYFAVGNEIANNIIDGCGVADFVFGGGAKNGEGIYIGTAPEQRADGKNPTADPDVSRDNWIHHNTITTRGAECVDIKEAATANTVEHNTCTASRDADGGGLNSRGNGNTFRYNTSSGHSGAGVRLGGDTSTDGAGNHVYGNVISNNAAGGIKFMATPQGQVCGNTMSSNTGGDSVGTYKSLYSPTLACP